MVARKKKFLKKSLGTSLKFKTLLDVLIIYKQKEAIQNLEKYLNYEKNDFFNDPRCFVRF